MAKHKVGELYGRPIVEGGGVEGNEITTNEIKLVNTDNGINLLSRDSSNELTTITEENKDGLSLREIMPSAAYEWDTVSGSYVDHNLLLIVDFIPENIIGFLTDEVKEWTKYKKPILLLEAFDIDYSNGFCPIYLESRGNVDSRTMIYMAGSTTLLEPPIDSEVSYESLGMKIIGIPIIMPPYNE